VCIRGFFSLGIESFETKLPCWPRLQFTLWRALLMFLMKCYLLLPVLVSSFALGGTAEEAVKTSTGMSKADPVSVYVIPVTEAIDSPNLFILRRGLKEAIANEVDAVVLDMDTPGGRVDVCLEMMEMLDRFEGVTMTYVNEDAISAGSFIAAATEAIYFSPRGKIGASAVIQGTGEDVPETARQKIESYLRANIRVMSAAYPYRAEVIRAMLDADYELKIGEEVIKPAGELLTLTAAEAVKPYGDPPEPLLGAGIYESVEALLEDRFGAEGYTIESFEVTYSEELAKWMQTFAPALMGLGLLLLFIEFKTPGWGIFGIGGIALIALFFISQNIAGLAGNEVIFLFLLGLLLVLVELLLLPGIIIVGLAGALLMMSSLLWAMVDYWPGGQMDFTLEMFEKPLMQLMYGLAIAVGGALLLARFLKGSWIERQLVLEDSVGGGTRMASASESESESELVGATGVVCKPLHPVGEIEIAGVRRAARCEVGTLETGARVRVLGVSDFNVIVEAAEE
jgi:membrane-bound serine protease (ClpP class)